MKTMQIIQDAIAEFLKQARLDYGSISSPNIGHQPTPAKRGGLRHRGFTKNTGQGESKKRRKMAAKSRRINRK